MKEAEVGRACNTNGRMIIETHTKIWMEDLKGRVSLPVLVISWRIILKCILQKQNGGLWNTLKWLKCGSVAFSVMN